MLRHILLEITMTHFLSDSWRLSLSLGQIVIARVAVFQTLSLHSSLLLVLRHTLGCGITSKISVWLSLTVRLLPKHRLRPRLSCSMSHGQIVEPSKFSGVHMHTQRNSSIITSAWPNRILQEAFPSCRFCFKSRRRWRRWRSRVGGGLGLAHSSPTLGPLLSLSDLEWIHEFGAASELISHTQHGILAQSFIFGHLFCPRSIFADKNAVGCGLDSSCTWPSEFLNFWIRHLEISDTSFPA